MRRAGLMFGLILPTLAVMVALRGEAAPKPKLAVSRFPNGTGTLGMLAPRGLVDRTGPFFANLGTNGRNCGTCHEPAAGWSITPALAQAQFESTAGTGPLFRAHDGANAPGLDIATPSAREVAYSMLLQRGVIRIGLPIPTEAEFSLDAVDDPSGFAGAAELSLFRRPLPANNLRFSPTVMWDGRQSPEGRSALDNLRSQALEAHGGHAQGEGLDPGVLESIVQFESGFPTAQVADTRAGRLDAVGVKGGPALLARQAFTAGSNSPFAPRFNRNVFSLFRGWKQFARTRALNAKGARGAIHRGERLFNEREFNISQVAGFNDVIGLNVVRGTCSSCHNAPGAGSLSLNLTMDIGVDGFFARAAGQPVYTLRKNDTGQLRTTSDPGRGLITGKWADIDRFKVPALRGLAARAPYFHDGSAPTVRSVVDFYVNRFGMILTDEEAQDMSAFLLAL